MNRRRPDFAVDYWEYVPGGGAVALLRIAGQWRDGDGPSAKEAELLAEGEQGVLHYRALPDPAAEVLGSGWRAAFAVDAGVAGSTVAYRLSVPGFDVLDLPQPVERGAPPAQPAPVQKKTAEHRRSLVEVLGLTSIRRAVGSLQQEQPPEDTATQRAPDIEAQTLDEAGRQLRAERERRVGLETAVWMLRGQERDQRAGRETAETKSAKATAEAARSTAQAESAQETLRDLQARTADLTLSLESERGISSSAVDAERRLAAELSRTEKELRKAVNEAERRASKIAALNQELSRAKEDRGPRSRRRIEALTQELAGSNTELEASRIQLSDKDDARARLEQELARHEQWSQATAESAARDRERFEAAWARLESELMAARGDRDRVTSALQELRVEHAAGMEVLAGSKRESEELFVRVGELEGELGKALERRGEVEARLLEVARELDAERTTARASSVRIEELEAGVIRRESELGEAISRAATVTQALDEANLRAVALESALAESDARAVSLREAREGLAAALEELRVQHAANVGALAVSRDEAEELVANWESELEGERSAAQAVAEQVRDLEAELQHRAGELEEAMAWVATLTQARDEADRRAATLERALGESDETAAAGRDAASRTEANPLSLEQLRAEAIRGRELATTVEERAAWLLDEVATR